MRNKALVAVITENSTYYILHTHGIHISNMFLN